MIPKRVLVDGYNEWQPVVSRFQVVHCSAGLTDYGDGEGTMLKLVDGREFSASEFWPYVEKFQGDLERCPECFAAVPS